MPKIRQKGLSLIEVLVAMAIGVILMLGMTQIFSASRAAFSSNEGLARIQENSRFAMEFLRQDLRMAGHMGCMNELAYQQSLFNVASPQRLFNHLLPPGTAPIPANMWPYRLDLPLQVYEYVGTAPGQSFALTESRATPAAGSWSPALPSDLVGDAMDGSDVVVVSYLSADSARLQDVLTPTGAERVIVNPLDASYVQDGSIYGITDCQNVSLFQLNAGGDVSQDVLNLRGWDVNENGYGPFNVLHRYRFVAYYVGAGADGGPALIRRGLAANGTLGGREELVPGVESLQVLLGVNLNLRNIAGDVPQAYLTGAQVEAGTGAAWVATTPPAPTATAQHRWISVVSFKLGLLMRNSRPGAADAPANSPIVGDTTLVPPADGRMRQTYEAQVAIRNRVRG